MKLLGIICKELGIDIGEKWLGNDGRRYKIDGNGRLLKAGRKIWAEESYCGYRNLLTGNLKPVWKPKEGMIYFYPYLASNEKERYDDARWDNSSIDNWYFNNDLAFETKEEAIELTNKILASLKED